MSEENFFDYIVIGLGGIGSGALYWLAKSTHKKVLGLEQFKLGHHNGGSQDHSRIIRLMYDDERYTKLARDTYTAFAEAERESGLQLVHKTGSLDLAGTGTLGEEELKQYASSMDKQNIEYEVLDNAELMRKYPQWRVENTVALYQKDGGLVDAALTNSVHVQLARAHGATVIDKCPVVRLEKLPGNIMQVTTTKGKFTCSKLVVCAGAWINDVIGHTGAHVPVYVTQEQVTYIASPNIRPFTKENFPIFIYHDENNCSFYGLPAHVNSAFKIALDAAGPVVTAPTRDFTVDPVREKLSLDFVKDKLPEADGPVMYSKTCLYTMTPDRHFVVDSLRHVGWSHVFVCNGAGHAFKWVGLLGKILMELATKGSTQYDISGFKITRDALRNPGTLSPLKTHPASKAQHAKL